MRKRTSHNSVVDSLEALIHAFFDVLEEFINWGIEFIVSILSLICRYVIKLVLTIGKIIYRKYKAFYRCFVERGEELYRSLWAKIFVVKRPIPKDIYCVSCKQCIKKIT